MNDAVTRRPVRLSAVISLLAAVIPVTLIESTATTGALVTVVGIVVAREGIHHYRKSDHILGGIGFLVGGGIGVAGVGLSMASASGVPALIEVGFSIAGIVCLGLGTLPVRNTGSRLLVKLGAALMLLCVVAGGLFQDAGVMPLLGACVAIVISWDAAENSINVGEQLGREPTTWTIESSHLSGTAIVGGVAVTSGLVVRDIGTPGLPLHSLVFLLVALVFLTLALHD